MPTLGIWKLTGLLFLNRSGDFGSHTRLADRADVAVIRAAAATVNIEIRQESLQATEAVSEVGRIAFVKGFAGV